MKLRQLLAKIRLRLPEGDDRTVDNVDALTTMAGPEIDDLGGFGVTSAPTNWVPSQQDERPRH